MSSRLRENSHTLTAQMEFDLARRVECLEKSQHAMLLLFAECLGENLDDVVTRYRSYYDRTRPARADI